MSLSEPSINRDIESDIAVIEDTRKIQVIPIDRETIWVMSYLFSTPLIVPNDSARENAVDTPTVQIAMLARGAMTEKQDSNVKIHFLSSLNSPGLINLYSNMEKMGRAERAERSRTSVHLTSTPVSYTHLTLPTIYSV